ncbi:MAG: hypothetical protein ACK5LN_13395 [Propioniciclava sp.]
MTPSHPERAPRRRAVALALAVLTFVVLAIGVGLGWVLQASSTPASLGAAPPITMVPAESTEITDSRTVELTAVRAESRELRSPRGGLVTWTACTTEKPLASGKATIAIDGVKVLNLATSVPLWRDLPEDARGDDVTALHAELTRLGHKVTGSRISSATVRALNRVRTAAKLPRVSTVDMKDLLWLPATEVTLTTCPLVGDQAEAGGPLGSAPATISAVSVSAPPSDAVAGERVLMIDGTKFPLDDQQSILSDDLPMAMQSPTLQGSLANPEVILTASWQLAEPLPVIAVPAAALGDVTGDTSCVVTPHGPERVEVIGSQLGRTYVKVSGDPPTEVSIDPARDRSCE